MINAEKEIQGPPWPNHLTPSQPRSWDNPGHGISRQNVDQRNETAGNNSLGGIAFDHGLFPKIVAIHKMERQNSRSPSLDKTKPPENFAMPHSYPMHVHPSMHRTHLNPANFGLQYQAYPPGMPDYFFRNGSAYPYQIPRPPHPSNHMPTLQRQHFAHNPHNKIRSPNEKQHPSSFPSTVSKQSEVAPPHTRDVGPSKQFTINYYPSDEPPKLLPISANINATSSRSALDKPPTEYSNVGPSDPKRNSPQVGYYPPYLAASLYSARQPFTEPGLHNVVSPVRFPYDHYSGNGTLQHQLVHGPSMNGYPDRVLTPNIDSSVQIQSKGFHQQSPKNDSVISSRRDKPYKRPSEAEQVFSNLLKLENKYDLLYVLKAGSDKSRDNIFNIVVKLLQNNFLDNSLCLLESLKTSDLTEKTKERILSVIEEIIWNAPPRPDLWANGSKLGPDKLDSSYDDQDLVKSLQKQSVFIQDMMSSSSSQTESRSALTKEINNNEPTNGCISPAKSQIDDNDSVSKSNNKLTKSISLENNDRDKNYRTSSADLALSEQIAEGDKDILNSPRGVVKQSQESESRLNLHESMIVDKKMDDSITICSNEKRPGDEYEEIDSSFPVVTKTMTTDKFVDLNETRIRRPEKPKETEGNEEAVPPNNSQMKSVENCLDGQKDASYVNNTVIKIEQKDFQSSCLHEEPMKKDIKESFHHNNHIVRNIFDLFT